MWRREVGDGNSASPECPVNLRDAVATAGDCAGVLWTLDATGDLNANLVRFGTEQGVEEHIDDEIEVIVVGVLGAEIVTVDQQEHNLSAGMLVFIPKGLDARP